MHSSYSLNLLHWLHYGEPNEGSARSNRRRFMDSFIVELTLFCAVAIALVATHRK